MAVQHDNTRQPGLRPWVVGADGQPDLSRRSPPTAPPSPFAVLGVASTLLIDEAALALQVRSLIRVLHPDRYFRDGAEAVADAERHTALVNDAWRTLRDFDRRVQWFLDAQPDTGATALPAAVAMAVFERNELLDEWLVDADRHRAELAALQAEVAAERAALTAEAQALAGEWDAALDHDPARVAALRQRMRAIFGHRAYLDNLLARLATP